VARTKLTSGSSEDGGSRFVTTSVAADPNSLVLLFVTSGKAGVFATTPPSVPRVIYGGQAMTRVNTVTANDRRLTCFQFTTAQAKSGSFTINFDGEQQDYCAWSAFAYDGVDTESPVAQSKAAATADAKTLTIDVPYSERNACVGAVILDAAVGATVGAGLGEIDEIRSTQGVFGRNATLSTLDAQPLVDYVSWTWSFPTDAAALVVEVAMAAPTGGSG
jgi:hypothetical protein